MKKIIFKKIGIRDSKAPAITHFRRHVGMRLFCGVTGTGGILFDIGTKAKIVETKPAAVTIKNIFGVIVKFPVYTAIPGRRRLNFASAPWGCIRAQSFGHQIINGAIFNSAFAFFMAGI
jgi:hypothetical protein